jgi:hypothetical protein
MAIKNLEDRTEDVSLDYVPSLGAEVRVVRSIRTGDRYAELAFGGAEGGWDLNVIKNHPILNDLHRGDSVIIINSGTDIHFIYGPIKRENFVVYK